MLIAVLGLSNAWTSNALLPAPPACPCGLTRSALRADPGARSQWHRGVIADSIDDALNDPRHTIKRGNPTPEPVCSGIGLYLREGQRRPSSRDRRTWRLRASRPRPHARSVAGVQESALKLWIRRISAQWGVRTLTWAGGCPEETCIYVRLAGRRINRSLSRCGALAASFVTSRRRLGSTGRR
jgi:hypothetical protein